MELNKYSKTITQDVTQPAAQAMLYGIGLTDHDLTKAQVGIVSMGYDGNTCNMHLNDLAKLVKQGVWDNEMVGLIFNTIGVSAKFKVKDKGLGLRVKRCPGPVHLFTLHNCPFTIPK